MDPNSTAIMDPNSTATEPVSMATCDDVNNFFFLVVGAMVFLMQMGFAMLEYSAVHPYHGATVLMKNLMDVCIAAFTWWLVGNGLAAGTDHGGFIGTARDGVGHLFYSAADETKVNGFVTGQSAYSGWFFSFAFAATAATIVSGAVAERTQFSAYFAYSIVLTALVYPVINHWIWYGGFLNEKRMIDFAGSGVVHMTGGVAALWGALIVGPRKFIETEDGYKPRFEDDGTVNEHKHLSKGLPFGVLGTIVLWFGWYGFNPGSVLGVCGNGDYMGTAIATTTISPAAAALTGAVYQMITNKVTGVKDGPDPSFICNCILGGLVGITAGAATVEIWAAMIIGAISTFVYMGSSKLLKVLKIDDVIDAFPVHGACGAWGLIATGLFTSSPLADIWSVQGLGNEDLPQPAGLLYDGSELIGWEIVGMLAIFGWVTVVMVPIFLGLKFTGFLRLSEELEKYGHSSHKEDDDVESGSSTTEAMRMKQMKAEDETGASPEPSPLPTAAATASSDDGSEGAADEE